MKPAVTTVVLAALAAHRGARLVANDTISEPLRHKLWMWSMLDVTPEQRRRREWLAGDTDKGSDTQGLINCPHCVGFHLSYLALGALALGRRRGWGWLRVAVVVAAVAGIQTTLASAQGALDTFSHVDPEALNDAAESAGPEA